MSQNSFRKSAALIALLAACPLALSLPAQADKPPAHAPAVNPEVQRLTRETGQALRQGNFSLATILIRNALRLDPNNGSLRGQLAYILLRGGDAASAEREARQARFTGAKDQDVVPVLMLAMLTRREGPDLLDQFPEPAPNDKSKLAVSILRARAQAFQVTGDGAAAIASMDRSLAIQRDAPGLLARGELSVLQNQPADAIKYIDQSLAMAPGNQTAILMKAAIVRAHDAKAALAMLDGLLKAHPGSPEATLARIEILIDQRRYDEAQKDVDAILAKSPNQPLANFYKAMLLGTKNQALDGWHIIQGLPQELIQSNQRLAIGAAQLALASGNVESANSILTAYVAQHSVPSSIDARVRLAAVRVRMNNTADALDVLQPLMDSKDPRIVQLIAATYAKANIADKAMEYMRKAQAMGNKDPALKYQIAIADLAQNNTARGLQSLGEILRGKPSELLPAVNGVTILIGQSKFADAQGLADLADKINPKSPIPAYLKGQILFSQHKPDASLVFFNQSLQRDPHYLPGLFAQAQIAMGQKKYADALRPLKLAQSLQPASSLAYIKLAEVAALMGQPAQSIGWLKQGIEKAPKDPAPRLVLARYQVTQRQYPDALATLSSALQIAPGDARLLALQGQVQQAMGQKAAALTTNKTLTQKYKQSGAAQALLANSMLANGDKAGALATFKHAAELSPDVQSYRSAIVNLQIQAGDKEAAVATARDWAASHKGPEGPILLAEVLTRVGRMEEAASVITKAEAVRPDWQLTLAESQIAISRGQTAHAIAVLKSWLTDHSADLPIRQAYGDALIRTGDNAGALAQYEIFLKTRDDNPSVLNNTAWLLRDKDPARALSLARKAADMQPGSPDIADTLGFLLLQKKDAKSALPVLQKAHANGPANGQITYHLALAFSSLGRKAEAKQMLQDALSKGGKFADMVDARKMLSQL